MPSLPPWNPLKISHVESQRSGSTELFRQVGWGRPMFITFFFFFFFYTKKHQRKVWKRTTPPRKGWAERAVTESIRATWSADSWGLSPLLEHKHWFFFPKPTLSEKGRSCYEQLFYVSKKDAYPSLPLLAHLWDQFLSKRWPAPVALKKHMFSIHLSSALFHFPICSTAWPVAPIKPYLAPCWHLGPERPSTRWSGLSRKLGLSSSKPFRMRQRTVQFRHIGSICRSHPSSKGELHITRGKNQDLHSLPRC